MLTFANCCLCLINVNDAWQNSNWCMVVDTKGIGKELHVMEKDKEEKTSLSDADIVPNRMKEGHRTISVFCLRGIPYLGIQGNV